MRCHFFPSEEVLGSLTAFCSLFIFGIFDHKLRCCVTNRKGASSIPDGVTGIFD